MLSEDHLAAHSEKYSSVPNGYVMRHATHEDFIREVGPNDIDEVTFPNAREAIVPTSYLTCVAGETIMTNTQGGVAIAMSAVRAFRIRVRCSVCFCFVEPCRTLECI